MNYCDATSDSFVNDLENKTYWSIAYASRNRVEADIIRYLNHLVDMPNSENTLDISQIQNLPDTIWHILKES